MTKRKSISKKSRFNVFKRDGWACQYCGKKPPETTLEIDHVIPVSKGGDNRMSNLLTACVGCNQGKGADSIEAQTPEAFTDAELARVQELLERRRAMARIQEVEMGLLSIDEADIDAVVDAWERWTFGDEIRAPVPGSARPFALKFVRELGLKFVVQAVDVAMTKKWVDLDKRWRYFCGICWKEIKERSGEEACPTR